MITSTLLHSYSFVGTYVQGVSGRSIGPSAVVWTGKCAPAAPSAIIMAFLRNIDL